VESFIAESAKSSAPIGSGYNTIAARIESAARRAGEVIAWIESARSFDPADIAAGSASLNPGLEVGLGG
jgi:hypothetical protein